MEEPIPLPEYGVPTPERYDETSRQYLCAARLLWDKELIEKGSVIAPCLQCLAFALELFLKARLLEREPERTDLRKLGHDLDQIWQMKEFEELREEAQRLAMRGAEVVEWSFPDPEKFTVDWTVKSLSNLCSGDRGKDLCSGDRGKRGIALRYPTGVVLVPQPQVLIWVLENVHGYPQFMKS